MWWGTLISTQAERRRKSAEEVKAKLAAAQTVAAQQDLILGERDASIQRVRDACQLERETSLKRQAPRIR